MYYENKLKKVMCELRRICPDKRRVKRDDLTRAIFATCGISRQTIKDITWALVKAKYIESDKHHVILTNRDLTDFGMPSEYYAKRNDVPVFVDELPKENKNTGVKKVEGPACLYHNGSGRDGVCTYCLKF